MFKVSYFLEVLPIIASKVNITTDNCSYCICFNCWSNYSYYRVLQSAGILSIYEIVCFYHAGNTGCSAVIFLLLRGCTL